MSLSLSIKNARRVESMVVDELRKTKMLGVKLGKASSMQEAEELGVSLAYSALDKCVRLNDLMFYIRASIRKLNDASKIAEHCNEIARLESLLSVRTDMRLPKAAYEVPYREEPYHMVGVPDSYLEENELEVRRIKRAIQSLKDKCNGTNAQLEVQFSDEQADLMRRYAFID